jgi:hypothetical protein
LDFQTLFKVFQCISKLIVVRVNQSNVIHGGGNINRIESLDFDLDIETLLIVF